MIDTQVHIIDPVRFPFPAGSQGYVPTPDETGTAEALLATFDANGFNHGVLVQASVYGPDNSAILSAVETAPDRLRAVVMTHATGLSDAAANPSIVGVRLNLTDFAGHGDVQAQCGFAGQVLEAGLVLQVQAHPEALTVLLTGLPDGPVILDHFGRPDLTRNADLDAIRRLADRDGCYLKVSGAFRIAGVDTPPASDARLAGLIDAFGPDRVIWGSDWPFLNIAGPRPDFATCLATGHALVDMERAATNARRLFGWGDG